MFRVIDHDNDNERTAETRPKAEDMKHTAESMGSENVEIVPEGTETKTDGGSAEVVEETAKHPQGPPKRTTGEMEVSESDTDALDQLGESLGTDPLSILPGHMVDTIQGQPAVNKRGYAMIAERYGIGVSANIEVYPWDNEEGRCVASAKAITEDGKEYSGWATASKDDGDMPEQLIELAETRALKRAVSWASGVGIVSYQEMSQQLEGGK